MNQEHIGKFIAKCRKDKNMTQLELADKLNVTDRAISNWENGRRLPDYSIIKDLCKCLDITINELFAGKKIEDEKFKDIADNNLLNALENSAFTLKDKIEYFKNKWYKEHFFLLLIEIIVIVFFIIYGFIKGNGLQYLFMILGFISGVIEHNRMMAYIEKNAYGNKSNIKPLEFKNYMTCMKETKELINKFKTKDEAVNYLMKETKLSKKECSNAYDIIINLDINKIDKYIA